MSSNSRPPSKPISVFLVDDDGTTRFLVRSVLDISQGQFNVVGEAKSAEKALAGCANLLPDVVMLDLHIDQENGLEILRRLKEDRKEIKVIILTGDTDRADEVFAAGADGYLIKPVEMETYADAIETVVSGARYSVSGPVA